MAAVGALLLGMASTAVADPGAVPTPDQVGDILNRVLDPNVDSADKSAVITPSLSPEDETQIAAAQRRLIFWNRLPLDFVVTDIQPAPIDYAGATVAAANLWELPPTPIVLNRQGGQWKVTDDTLTPLMYAIWHAARDRNRGFAGI
ncbi:hypothetical protein KIH27_13750 [Mycobacterium sp. M1]|uniref:Low molecular weight antigen MTB12-like C-terminal domain-containing protein n=1 Tax=Mycolicibacter acidiphilus TaxID=2835306 RepID=A0ABS5RK33_9MYCO|nr:hypothetical protein [Mycolicibacter acidiphilus]MBS9534652.1 hypothetical protein [Mycolicibacter acidiphilus]